MIETRSGGRLTFALPTLYPTLLRLENRGLIKGRWVERAASATAAITGSREGRRVLTERRATWQAYVEAVNDIMGHPCVTGRRSSGRASALGRLTPEREARIVRELASQLEDFYRDALAARRQRPRCGDAYARRQVTRLGRVWPATSARRSGARAPRGSNA